MKKSIAAMILCLSLFMVGTASASNILYFNDLQLGPDYMLDALGSTSHTVVTATDSADFALKIATGDYDLGIIMIQYDGSQYYSDAIAALGAFVVNGGLSIYTDWSENNSYAALFGAQWTGTHNYAEMTVTNPTLSTGLSGSINLAPPFFMQIYNMGVTGAEVAGEFSGGYGSIVIGNNGRSITNGFLTNSFEDSAQGVQLYRNEIEYLLGPDGTSVPEPSTFILLGLGLAGAMFIRRRK